MPSVEKITTPESTGPAPRKRVNLRTPEVMERVQAEVEKQYQSALVQEARRSGGILQRGGTTVRLAKEFGFCYGVERAIDLAYAASKVFAGQRIYILGEIIHNPDVNEQIAALGIQQLPVQGGQPDLGALTPEDVVIFPAFGAEVGTVEAVKAVGCQIVDTTCGDVMSVWRRVKQNAREQVTSIIHGKARHEETRATASRALGAGEENGHYLIVLNLEETDLVCRYLTEGGNREEFLQRFAGAHSHGFNPDQHLQKVGVANQTTMLRSETEEVQRRLRLAIAQRDGGSEENFRFFDTICGATQDRQDALFSLLHEPLDLLLVVGGYNSSNTTHLVEIGTEKVPTYFVRDHHRLRTPYEILHFDPALGREISTADWFPAAPRQIGVTAGASCPNNLIEEIIHRLFDLAAEVDQPLSHPSSLAH
jgi:4-hydroxy-3-methylbut-2-enyl diphosphate reductase